MQLSDIRPIKGKVLVRRDKPQDTTESGIILGVNDKGRKVTATVLSGRHEGKRIVFSPGVSSTFDVEGEKVTVIFESDIIAFI